MEKIRVYKSPDTLSITVIAVFIFMAVLSVLGILFSAFNICLLQAAIAQTPLLTNTDSESYLAIANLLDKLWTIGFIGTAILVLVWVYRCNQNLHAMGLQKIDYSPGFSVGAFFIPVANLVYPILIVSEIFRGSNPDLAEGEDWRKTPTNLLIPTWWICYIIMCYIRNFASYGDTSDLNSLILYNRLGLASFVLSLISIYAIVMVVKQINTRMIQKHQRLSALASVPGEPAPADV